MADMPSSSMDDLGGYVRIMVFDFSSTFNTIQDPILGDKLEVVGVEPSFVSSDHRLPDRTTTVHQAGELCLWDGCEQHWGSTGDYFRSFPVYIVHSRL